MLWSFIIFLAALGSLILSAKFFIDAAEKLGQHFKLPALVVGIFIAGIGTSIPELISGIIAVQKGFSDILPSNIVGANIANILLVTGVAVVVHGKTIRLSGSSHQVDLHFLLGSFMYFYIAAYDGEVYLSEAIIGIFIFLVYSVYLIKGKSRTMIIDNSSSSPDTVETWPIVKQFVILLATLPFIYLGAEYTVWALSDIAQNLNMSSSVVALSLLSLGTTLPELTVNISAVRRNNTDMAIGNILGSSVFNTLAVPDLVSFFGKVVIPDELLYFALPVMAACGLLFYLLVQDKKITVWEGLMFIGLYLLFMLKITVSI